MCIMTSTPLVIEISLAISAHGGKCKWWVIVRYSNDLHAEKTVLLATIYSDLPWFILIIGNLSMRHLLQLLAICQERVIIMEENTVTSY